MSRKVLRLLSIDPPRQAAVLASATVETPYLHTVWSQRLEVLLETLPEAWEEGVSTGLASIGQNSTSSHQQQKGKKKKFNSTMSPHSVSLKFRSAPPTTRCTVLGNPRNSEKSGSGARNASVSTEKTLSIRQSIVLHLPALFLHEWHTRVTHRARRGRTSPSRLAAPNLSSFDPERIDPRYSVTSLPPQREGYAPREEGGKPL